MDVVFVFFLLQRGGLANSKWLQSFGFLQTKALGFSVVWGGEQELLLLEHGQEIFFHLSSLSFVPPLCR